MLCFLGQIQFLMKKISTLIVLLFAFTVVQTTAQVNYTFKVVQSIYTPLVNATQPPLFNPKPTGYYEEDEGFSNQVPIGFAFNFNNNTYTHLNINANGFVTFGAGFTMDVNERYSKNNLTSGPLQDNARPIIAPLWDDLWLADTTSLKYKTAGIAPNRTFTVEWGNVMWDYNNLDTVISFQMILFETSNKVQFVYKSLNGNPANASASIGIATCSKCLGSFLSVNNLTANAAVSGIKEFNTINTKPPTGLAFEFEPGTCSLPEALLVNEFNSRKISFSWNSITIGSYDYAVTTSEMQPEVFSTTTSKNVSVDNLNPGTQYFIHVRTTCSSNGKSAWVTIPFKTLHEVSLPYIEKFERIATPAIPEITAIANPFGGNEWRTIALSALPPYNNVLSVRGDDMQAADAWFVLPGMQLEGGNTYRTKFKFRVSDTISGIQKLEIKIGTKLNDNMTGWQTIYRNLKINQLSFKDTAFSFAPPTDDVYFIAFRCVSDKNIAALWIDDIETEKVKPLPVKFVTFSGVKNNKINQINWRTSAEIRNSYFELQRSADGKNFTSVSTIQTKAVNGNSAFSLDYTEQDLKPNTIDYYRLKITDLDSNQFYSQTIKVAGLVEPKLVLSKMYPNPAKDILTAIIYSPYNARTRFRIVDSYGKLVLEIPVTLSIGDNIIRVDVSKFAPGIYYSKMNAVIGGESEAKMFVKQ